jgi:ankyrin repeat protein
VKLLLEKGADPHVQNKDLHTPLDLARIEDHDKNVAALSVASSVCVTAGS